MNVVGATTARVAGHLGELVQGRLGPGGPVVLVTLPCPVLAVTLHRAAGAFALVPTPVLTDARAKAFLAALDLPVSGRLQVVHDMPPGGGAGSSTAALVALAHAAGVTDPDRIAVAAVAVEGATDPLALDSPDRILWASRSGRGIRTLPPLPALEVVGGFYGPPVATDPSDDDFPDITDLLDGWPEGLAVRATASACRTAAHRGRDIAAMLALQGRLGAAGMAIAHTGSAVAFLFPPGDAPRHATDLLADAGVVQPLLYRLP
jgi:uncharacterized protein involved in propanediol utilization